VVTVPSELRARPKLTALAPAGTAGVAQLAGVQPLAAGIGGLVTQNFQVPADVR
jgi:hypothetical protein